MVCSDGLRVARSIKKSANQFGAATVSARRLIGIRGQDSVPGAVAQFDGDPAHFGEVADNFFGQSTGRVAASGDLGDVQIRHEDDAMDELHRHLFTVLMDREWKHGVAAAVDITLLGRFYERFADHAVEGAGGWCSR